MALVLLIIGVIMVTAAVRNTVTTNGSQEGLVELLESDFTGTDNFIYWLVAILVIGGIGYVPSLRNLSNGFLVLVIIGLLLSNGGFFSQFQKALGSAGSSATGTTAGTTGVSSLLSGLGL